MFSTARIRSSVIKQINGSRIEPLIRKIYPLIFRTKANEYDSQMRHILQRTLTESSNCIDIGAYRGEVLREFLKSAPQGKHYAFEPVKENYVYLKKRFPNSIVRNIALSDRSGNAIFNFVSNRPARSGLKEVDYPDNNTEVEKVKVKVSTIDSVIPKSRKIDLIKIDVEGAELSVLRGSKYTISQSKPYIVFEHADKNSKHYGVKAKDIFNYLHNNLEMDVYTFSSFLSNKKRLDVQTFSELIANHAEFNFIAEPQKK